MKALVVGLGSMGRRRIRNLQALDFDEIAGFDLRPDRVADAVSAYGVLAFDSFAQAMSDFNPDFVVVSTSPEAHLEYVEQSVALGRPCFVEASVVDVDRIAEIAAMTRADGPLVAPSCTMKFFPGPQAVRSVVEAGLIGKPLSFTYQVGQWLPDWHPWEDISDFYVSKRETGGCREIVPFELTWLNGIFGTPRPLACDARRISAIPADIDDAYHCFLEYPNGLVGTLNVDVLSRPMATREFRMYGSEGLLVFSGEEQEVRFASTSSPEWNRIQLGGGTKEAGYIYPEEPYIRELGSFVAAVRENDPMLFPNDLDSDVAVLRTLVALEEVAVRSDV